MREKCSTTSTEYIYEIEVVKEVNHFIAVVVAGGVVGAEGIDEVEVIEEIDDAIVVEISGTDAVDENAIEAEVSELHGWAKAACGNVWLIVIEADETVAECGVVE